MPLVKPADMTRMFWIFLKGQDLSYFEDHLRRRLEGEESDVSDNQLIEFVLTDIGLEYIPNSAYNFIKTDDSNTSI
jgi:hypothetical protein